MVNHRFMWRVTLGRAAFKRLTGRGRGRLMRAGGGVGNSFVAFRFFVWSLGGICYKKFARLAAGRIAHV